ncbi:uncharacterized protein C594.04c, partial [Eurytemora carolleeae]|uniref:uncharacterized protein C594.04c n=1 Tax=Eurytemora carolleeae TaxID=1294199 RepID=UPI000C78159C
MSIDTETRVSIFCAYFVIASVGYVLLNQEDNSHYQNKNNSLQDLGWILDELSRFPSSSGSYVVDICARTCLFFTVLVFVLGELTGNVSQVDKLWSILPCVYVWEIALVSPSPRLYLILLPVTIWGIRLTYNFSRRGGYSWPPWTGEEDYRWEHLRKWPVLNTRIGWFLFNLFFISIYQ